MNIQDIPPEGGGGGKFTLSVDSYDQTFHGIDILLR